MGRKWGWEEQRERLKEAKEPWIESWPQTVLVCQFVSTLTFTVILWQPLAFLDTVPSSLIAKLASTWWSHSICHSLWETFLTTSVQFSCSVMSDSLRPHGLQHARLPWPSPTPGAYSNSRPSSRWCHPTISSSVVPFSSHLQSFPGSGSFPMSQFFASCGQSIGASASASVLPMHIQDWFPLGLTGWISLQSKRFSRVFSNTK